MSLLHLGPGRQWPWLRFESLGVVALSVKMIHSVSQLQGGARDFCSVLDQVPTAFFWKSLFLPRFQNGTVDAVKLENLGNATLDSSLLSIRILNDFFRADGRPTDVKAHHYGGFCPPGEFLSASECTDINKHVAHLTTERADMVPKSWPLEDLVVRAHNAAEPFIQFLLSPAGVAYRPTNFDLQSRLTMCQGFENHVRAYLKQPKRPDV